MFWNKYMGMQGDWGFPDHWWGWIIPLAILDFVLKAFSLWRSARREEKVWFIALLVVNSLGILPAIYLLTHPDVKTKKK
ncbi:hypothetical protein HY502_02190 [Candidatus Woesebacteria bacterium]|nr:hypothetical protein [Candidatus Woesebacteria bacterium]